MERGEIELKEAVKEGKWGGRKEIRTEGRKAGKEGGKEEQRRVEGMMGEKVVNWVKRSRERRKWKRKKGNSECWKERWKHMKMERGKGRWKEGREEKERKNRERKEEGKKGKER